MRKCLKSLTQCLKQSVSAQYLRGPTGSSGTSFDRSGMKKEERGLDAGRPSWEKGRCGFRNRAIWRQSRRPWYEGKSADCYLQFLKDFLLGLKLFIWLAFLIALHKHSLTRSRAGRRVQRLNLAACSFSGKTHRTR